MSDVKRRERPARYGGRVTVNRDLFLAACAAKGATTADSRAVLLGVTQKMAYLYEYGHTAPNLITARRIAASLDVLVDDLWPHSPAERAA